MLLYITIAVLFVYTIALIVFFLGGCTMIPTRCHPRRGIPFSRVKSPRRNTKFIEIDSVSSSQSLDMLKHIHQLAAKRSNSCDESVPHKVHVDDYLHPKYSLPPIDIDPAQRQHEYELLRFPGRAVRVEELPAYTRAMHDILLI